MSKKEIDDCVNCTPDCVEKVLRLLQINVSYLIFHKCYIDWKILRKEKE